MKVKTLVELVIWFIYLLFAVILITSCKSLEERCNDTFPILETEIVREVRKTDTLLVEREAISYLDTTECLPSMDTHYVLKEVVKQLPSRELVYEYECIDTVLVYRDAAKVEWLKKKLNKQTGAMAENKTYAQQLRNALMICVGIISFLLLMVIALVAYIGIRL